ncbi:class I SAM-dependent methyltransferase [Psychromicrobium lacuslunae]|uniref:Methyltransferase type 11 n=1 Tax=Psychromicrobium lacuslunae TaxID=1618207 RepID=A0A0D4BWR6_9MICC|nr:class I SAM-dependent methyltransferase [Psychromicrobium lacuslunae]AJT40764.1 methyltransferase type 11 [Psychromicrobium lacuslunae]
MATNDEQLAELYDAQNLWAADDDFFLEFVNQQSASRVLDLGCGTGRLTLALAAAGHQVYGVDPDSGALAAARRKPGAEQVTWIEGTSAQIPELAFDSAVMTAHVAQHITDQAGWQQTLRDLHRALRPGGRLAFDSRNPEARAWETWNPEQTRETQQLSDGYLLESWLESEPVADGLVNLTEYRILPDGSTETQSSALVFRSAERLTADLEAAGFSVEQIYGGWQREPVAGNRELIVLARS